jgi:putative transposase
VSRGIFTQMTANVFDMAKMVKRAYKYRFYPTPEQAAELSRIFGCVRKVWSGAGRRPEREPSRSGSRP